jgi:hypothetical protein
VAVVGEAYVVIRAATNRVLPDIQRSLAGADALGKDAGRQISKGIDSGFAGAAGGGGFMAFAEKAEASRVQLRRFSNAVRFLAPALTAIVGIIGAVGGGLITFGAAVGNAARGSIVLVASLGALITALLTAKALLGGISEAYKAKINAQSASGAGNKAELAALRRLEKARIALKRLIEEEAPEALAAAREKAADAARAAADALLSAERTQRSYNESQKAALDALENLNSARDRAREKLQQLRFELEGAAIGEKRARLEFEKARDSLQAVQDLPPNSRARQEAELAFAQAELNLRKAIDSNSDLKKEEDAATRAGVEGSKDVVDAKEALAKAQQREADLAIDTAKAFERAARAQRDAARAAADAAAGGRVEQELNRRIADAREAVKDAEEDLANARRSAAGNNALADAYKNLNAAGITLTESLVRLREKFIEFRKATSTPFLTLLNTAVLILEDNLFNFAGIVEETGRIVGELAVKFAKAFLEGQGAARLRKVWGTNNVLLERLGNTALNLAQAFIIILDAAKPLIDTFGRWAESKSAGFLERLSKDGNGLAETFANVQRNASLLGTLFGKIFEGFGIIGKEINKEGGAAQILLEGLITRTSDWVEGLRKGATDGSLSELFVNLSKNFLLVLDVIGLIASALIDIGAQPGITQFLESLKRIVGGEDGKGGLKAIGTELAGENGAVAKLGEFLELVVGIGLATFSPEAIVAFFITLNGILKEVLTFVQSDAFQQMFDKVAPLIAQAAALGFVWRAVKFAVYALIGTILLLGIPFYYLRKLITAGSGPPGTGGFLGAMARGAMTAFKALAGPLGWIIAGIILMWENSQMFRDSIMASFAALGEVFMKTFESLKPVFSEIGDGLSGVFDLLGLIGRVAGDILSFVMPVITVILGTIIGAIGGIIETIGGLVSIFTNVFGFLANLIQAFFGLFVGIFTGNFDMFVEKTEAATKNVVNIFKGLVRVVLGLLRGIVNGFVDAWNGLASRLKFKLPDWLGGFSFSVPQIPRIPDLLVNFAKGGVVPATSGGMLARIGEAGRAERVEPLDPSGLSKRDRAMIDMLSGGGGGATINVYPSQGMDERELAELVSRKLAYQMRRGAV